MVMARLLGGAFFCFWGLVFESASAVSSTAQILCQSFDFGNRGELSVRRESVRRVDALLEWPSKIIHAVSIMVPIEQTWGVPSGVRAIYLAPVSRSKAKEMDLSEWPKSSCRSILVGGKRCVTVLSSGIGVEVVFFEGFDSEIQSIAAKIIDDVETQVLHCSNP